MACGRVGGNELKQRCVDGANYLEEAWSGLEGAEKRKIVESITDKIVIAKNEVEIDLCHLPSSKYLSKGPEPTGLEHDVAPALWSPFDAV